MNDKKDFFKNHMNEAGREFIAEATTLPYKNSSSAVAKRWAMSNIDTDADTLIDGVTLQIIGGNEMRTLKIYVKD